MHYKSRYENQVTVSQVAAFGGHHFIMNEEENSSEILLSTGL
jgi:hypothetical protein